jgi:hypothetical protein
MSKGTQFTFHLAITDNFILTLADKRGKRDFQIYQWETRESTPVHGASSCALGYNNHGDVLKYDGTR